MTDQIYIARDENTGLSIGGGVWTFVDNPYWFGGQTVWPGFSTVNGPFGSMNFSFQGTAVALFGNTPSGKGDNLGGFQVSLDNGKPQKYISSTGNDHPQTYIQWYQSPALDDSTHSVDITNMYGAVIDILVITPGQNTDLRGHTLMVDDGYSGISYNGKGWTQESDHLYLETSNGDIVAKAFQNGTHQTSTPGDSFSFMYTGSNATFYGIQPQRPGLSMKLSYTIDNGLPTTLFISPSGTDGTDTFNFPFLSTGPLDAGNHTVVVNLTSATQQSLILDYILFTPSFNNLASMPNLTTPSPTSPSQSSPASSSGSTGPDNSDSGSQGHDDNSTHTSSKSAIVGPAAGGVVGGVVLLIALAIFFYRYKRQRSPFKSPVVVMDEDKFNNMYTQTSVAGTSTLPVTSTTYNDSSSATDASSLPFAGMAQPSPPRAGKHRPMPQADLQRRISELQNLIVEAEARQRMRTASNPGPTPTDVERQIHDVAELRRRIEVLTLENARLTALSQPPPAYEPSQS